MDEKAQDWGRDQWVDDIKTIITVNSGQELAMVSRKKEHKTQFFSFRQNILDIWINRNKIFLNLDLASQEQNLHQNGLETKTQTEKCNCFWTDTMCKL